MNDLPVSPGIYHQICPINGMTYSLSVPTIDLTEPPAALIIALHWSGPVSPYFSEGILTYLVEPALGELGAIIAAPDCRFANWTNLRSENQVLELIDYLVQGYNLSPQRTILTGYSMGGTGAWYMATRRPARFCAAIPISCAPHPDIPLLDFRLPLYVIHSRRDELIYYEQVDFTVQKLRQRGLLVEFDLLDEPTHYDTDGFIESLQATQAWIRQRWQACTPPEEK
jgi:pimeloyl-ACP methyl ester carboxylesterase